MDTGNSQPNEQKLKVENYLDISVVFIPDNRVRGRIATKVYCNRQRRYRKSIVIIIIYLNDDSEHGAHGVRSLGKIRYFSKRNNTILRDLSLFRAAFDFLLLFDPDTAVRRNEVFVFQYIYIYRYVFFFS